MLHCHPVHSSSNYIAAKMDAQRVVAEKDKPIHLPDVTIEDFTVYAKFLYTGLIFTKEANIAELTRCLYLYKAAKQLQATDFQDAIVDALIEIALEFRAIRGQCRFAPGQITTIYAITKEGSLLRKFAQNLFLQSKGLHGFDKKRLEDFPAEFRLDLLSAAAPYITSSARSADMQDPLDLSKSCKYHEHTVVGTPCYKTKHQSVPHKPVAVAASAVPESSPVAASDRQTERVASDAFELQT